MPTVPTYDSFQASSNTLSPARIDPIDAPNTAGKQAQQFGQALSTIGEKIGLVAAKEIEEADTARLEQQYTKLSRRVDASLYADGGVMGLSGSQAVGAADKWAADYDKVSAELSAELHPRQSQRFQKIVQTAKRTYYDNVMRHEFRQAQSYKDETNKAVLDQALESAGNNYRDGETVNLQFGVAQDAMKTRPEYAGASAEVRKRMDAALEGSFHAQVVKSALDAGDTAYASDWFNENKSRIPLDMRGKVERQLKPATDFAEGKEIASEAQKRIAAGESPVAVETWMAEKARSKDAHGIAQGMMREYQDAQRRQDAHVQGGFLERFETAPSHKTFTAIMGDRGFQSMEPESRGKLVKYMRAELEQAGDKARARQNDRYRSPEAFGKFIDTLDAPNFAGMSRQEIYNLRPEIGPELTTKLLAEHKAASGTAARFQIDKDLLNEAVPKELLAKGNKDKLNAYHGIVETELIKWKQDNPGKLPTLDEQKKIARAANAEYVVAGRVWGTNAVKAYDLKPMPDDFRAGAIAEYAKRGKPAPTPAQLLELWAKQKGSY